MEGLLIKNGSVLCEDGFKRADVLFDYSVQKIGENIEPVKNRTFDAEKMLVLPGLIDTHMHMKNVTIDLFGTDASAACFPNGVTCAAEAAACFNDEAFLDTFSVKTVVFVGGEIKNNRFASNKIDYKKYGKRALGIKLFYDAASYNVRDITPLKEAVSFAKDNGLKVMVHTTGTPVPMMEIVNALNKGDILTHAFHGGENNSLQDDFQCLLYAKEKGVIVDAGFAGHVHTDFNVLKTAIEKGIFPDTAGSDITRSSAFIRSGSYGLNYCMSILRTLGMPENEIFKAVTVNAARALNKQGEWGELKVGSTDACVLSLCDKGYSITDKFGNTVSDSKSYCTNLTVVNGDAVFSR